MVYASQSTKYTGFTLIEMMIAISIFFIITAVVLFNHGKFNSSINVTNRSYEVALAVREAQVYGLAVRQDANTPGSDDFAYGIHFEENSNIFYTFADRNSNRQFDFDPGDACVGGIDEECVERHEMIGSVTIDNLSVTSDADISELTILFLRPNPLALIYGAGSVENENSGAIRLYSERADKYKLVVVEFSGQISVQDIQP